MRTVSAGALAALASSHVALVQLVLLEFPSGQVAINTSNWPLVWAGVTYKGAFGLGSISAIEDSPGSVKGITFTLDGGPGDMISLGLDGANEVQGTFVTIRDAILETATYTIQDAPIAWAGRLDTMSIAEDGEHAAISCSAESRAVDLMRGTPMTYSDADQQAMFPGDRALEFVVSQVGKPVIWPMREFFFK